MAGEAEQRRKREAQLTRGPEAQEEACTSWHVDKLTGEQGRREQRLGGPEAQLTRRMQRSKGAAEGGRRIGWGDAFQVSGLGDRASGTAGRVRVRVRDYPNLNLVLKTSARYLTAETWDLRMDLPAMS